MAATTEEIRTALRSREDDYRTGRTGEPSGVIAAECDALRVRLDQLDPPTPPKALPAPGLAGTSMEWMRLPMAAATWADAARTLERV